MSNLTINPPLLLNHQDYISITPSPTKPPPRPNQDLLTSAELRQNYLIQFWDTLVGILVKIPFIRNLMVFVWTRGLNALQPSKMVENSDSLLFNSGIEIPSWFEDDMQEQCILSWKDHFTSELKMICDEEGDELNRFARLSQVLIPEVAYQNEEVMRDLLAALEESIVKLVEQVQTAYPNEPLQLHLGGRSYESPLERKPLSSLFLRAFASCLASEETQFPLRFLHVHGPLDNPQGINVLLEGLKNCPTLYHLHLDLDAKSAQKAFSTLADTLDNCVSLGFLVFQKDPNPSEMILTEEWGQLAQAIRTHEHLASVSFYGHTMPPESFHESLAPHKITSPVGSFTQGFCIKIRSPLQ